MKKLLIAVGIVGAVTVPTMGSASADKPSCNWGKLTAESVTAGFPQGAHASDPSGDGHGPGTADEPRDGLANVGERGNLELTCIVIASMLP